MCNRAGFCTPAMRERNPLLYFSRMVETVMTKCRTMTIHQTVTAIQKICKKQGKGSLYL
jgi:hypothetical protein